MPRSAVALVLALALGAAAQYLFYRQGLGLNALAATVLFLGAAWQLGRPRLPLRDLWMPAFALAFAAFLAIRTDGALIVFDLLALLTLAFATTASLRGVTVTSLPFGALCGEALRTAADAAWRALPVISAGTRPLARAVPSIGRVLPYVGGVVLALPFVLLFLWLFRSADAVFDRAWRDLLDVTRWWTWLSEAKDRTLVALISGWIAAGALADRGPAPKPGARVTASGTVLTAFIATLVALFAGFVFVQLTYLFGGGDTLAAASMTHSEYARRGFFELLFVGGLVAAVVFACELIVDRPARGYMGSTLALLGFTGVIVASAVHRMDLYQRAYGWSELRLYALAAIAAVAGALVILACSIVTRRTPFAAQPIVFVALGIALIVNALAPSAFVVRANVLRAPTAEAPRVDLWHLGSLGRGALPELVASRGLLPEPDRRCLDLLLYRRYFRAGPEPTPAWQSWNYDDARARDALAWLSASVFPSVDPRDAGVCHR